MVAEVTRAVPRMREARPTSSETGPPTTTEATVHPSTWSPEPPPTWWLDAWVQGYCAGWDTAVSAEVDRRLLELAETIARHDRERWAEVGELARERRIAREIAEMEAHARRIAQELYGGGGSDAAA